MCLPPLLSLTSRHSSTMSNTSRLSKATHADSKKNNEANASNPENYPSLKRVNDDSAVGRQREANPERFLENNHVLVQIHLERGIISCHCRNPKGPSAENAAEPAPGNSKRGSAQEGRRWGAKIESPATGELQWRHLRSRALVLVRIRLSYGGGGAGERENGAIILFVT